MSELIPVVLRFVLYADLMLVFGLGLFGFYAARRLLSVQRLLRVLAGLGVLVSVLSMLAMTQAMSGAEDWPTLWAHLHMMLAAAGWLGALAAFGLLLVSRSLPQAGRVQALARTLAGFGRIGSGFVAVLMVTGVANYLFVVGPNLDGLTGGRYGLLCLKLGLFGLMLGLAALNRVYLAPRLQRSLAAGEHGAALKALRRSIALELVAVVVILGLVAWLGTLAPT